MSGDALSARLDRLSAEERAVLARRLAENRAAHARSIPARDPEAAIPMSFAQWRLWFLEQLRPGTNAWNTAVAATIHGPLQRDALERALQYLVRRHPTLRTVFVAPAGQPRPVLLEDRQVQLSLPIADASKATVRSLIECEIARPFDLEHDLMLRPRLIRLGPEDHVLVLVAHHIAVDGWSKGLLLGDLAAAYEALAGGREPRLPELPVEYADFAIWQRARLTSTRLQELVDHWRSQLEGAPPALELPADHPRPPTQSFAGAARWLAVPAELAQPLLALGRAERATPFMTMLAAFKVLLHAHTGQADILVGSPAAMRTHPELERIVGCFANTLVYRTSLAAGPSFRELLTRVRETALGVYAHQELPFEKIVEAVAPPRDPGRNPLVQVNMRLEGAEPELRLADTRCRPIVLDPGIARFDLAIELAPAADGLAGYLEYDTALFDPASAETFATDFVAVLESLITAPDEPIAELRAVRNIQARRGGTR
ncbi:MAG TPA: condensation domain-containing protein [Solirubrobacteraceae bacterium]